MTPAFKVREFGGDVEKARAWAREQTTNFINANSDEAKRLAEESRSGGRAAALKIIDAWEAFGRAVHPIMDGSSPAHRDFQVYDSNSPNRQDAETYGSPALGLGVFIGELGLHSEEESREPTEEEMNRMVDDMRMQYRYAFGEVAYDLAVPLEERQATEHRKNARK